MVVRVMSCSVFIDRFCLVDWIVLVCDMCWCG